MGDPKRIRKKYDTPIHPWIKSRIDDERRIAKEFGTKNKKEIWKAETVLKKFKQQAKKLLTLKTEQAEIEKQHLFRRVGELGLIKGEVSFDGILSLTTDDILARRLQSVVFSKGLARSMNQARQFITHEHVVIADKVISSPAYLVTVEEESKLGFSVGSGLFREDHPERARPEEDKAEKVAVQKEAKKVAETKEEPKKEESKEESKVEATEEKAETATEEAKEKGEAQ